ncbi:DUF3861 domain-containing protein [Terriglobus aquaticus]|uniref:DUF3861 domain-containing protein n=1 Tax=Terriglobus aquaticus TaxID=940139 RepID=A0ABW9KR06_9BACT|nr:DUF3861 domain-containing protein [Terriglobus aquaticus]
MALFRITVERIDGPLDSGHDLLSFEAKNHDDILAIASRARHLPGMEPDETAALAIGMKLFGEVMLKYRKQSPFAELMPHFREFISDFKAAVRAAVPTVGEPLHPQQDPPRA